MSVNKVIITAEEMRQESWRLAARVNAAEAPFDLVLGLARGGVPIALYFQEFFLLARPEHRTAYATVRCRSYTAIGEAGGVRVGSLEEAWQELGGGSRILVVDDIFDRGTTIQTVCQALRGATSRPLTVRTCTLHYKPANSVVDITPDYHGRTFAGNDWIVYPQALSDFVSPAGEVDYAGAAALGLPADIIAGLKG